MIGAMKNRRLFRDGNDYPIPDREDVEVSDEEWSRLSAAIEHGAVGEQLLAWREMCCWVNLQAKAKYH